MTLLPDKGTFWVLGLGLQIWRATSQPLTGPNAKWGSRCLEEGRWRVYTDADAHGGFWNFSSDGFCFLHELEGNMNTRRLTPTCPTNLNFWILASQILSEFHDI